MSESFQKELKGLDRRLSRLESDRDWAYKNLTRVLAENTRLMARLSAIEDAGEMRHPEYDGRVTCLTARVNALESK